jgi:hypothetical protein
MLSAPDMRSRSVKLVRERKVCALLGVAEAALLLANAPERYNVGVRGRRVTVITDKLPVAPEIPAHWVECWRNSRSAVIAPSPEWLHSVGYAVSL